ncbi:hypothetical protein PR048_008876 [Dryococelus australis]|uniref:Aminopeptidase n=1 Tax=Dryococelus australis TaxID=614101 RepID=A0ABQ9HYB8_9NEOP|nr:hypothetical protein PR048_008876 [Dryococelus australis]
MECKGRVNRRSRRKLANLWYRPSRRHADSLRQLLADVGQSPGNTLLLAERNLAWLATHSPALSSWLKTRWYRLPNHVQPLSYVLDLVPRLHEDFSFDGRALITVNATSPTSSVILHADDIVLNHISVASADGELEVLQYSLQTERQFLEISLGEQMSAGQLYTLNISYTGFLRDDMYGFYRSYYDVDGQTRWIATTQFQPTSARRAFPCFDEPGFKATFKISIARSADMHALSNMPLAYSEYDDTLNMTWDHFEETPMTMSTYLVAFVVSNFVNASSDDGFYRTWQREAAVAQAQYSIEVSPSIMRYLEDYTGLDYFLPKMDQVAVPDFSAGAMENWGLVTYRERNILHLEEVSNAENRQRTADIISHEFAHQWFGNLVSPKWWGDTWLNEGFGRYFQYFATAQVESSWRYEEQFVVRQLQAALVSDSLSTSHPMSHVASSPAEVAAMFSTISYAKAGDGLQTNLIPMPYPGFEPRAFRTPDRWRTNRLRHRSGNGTTEPDYLFAAMQVEYSGTDVAVKTVMDSWIHQVGYPLITVTRNYTTGSLTVSQERFLADGSGSDSSSAWWVPLTYTSQSELNFNSTATMLWLTNYMPSLTLLNVTRPAHWVLFNIQQTGFYRVNYDVANWGLLSRYLDSEEGVATVYPVSRAQLVDDVFALAGAGVVGYPLALELSRYLTRETDYVPWYAALGAFTRLDARLRGAAHLHYHDFKMYVRGLLQKAVDEVGFDARPSDSHVTKLLRGLVMKWACNLGDQNCISNATKQLADSMADPSSNRIDPDMAAVVYCNGLRYGGEMEWQFLWQKYLSSNVSTEQVLLLENLGCTSVESLAHRSQPTTVFHTLLLGQTSCVAGGKGDSSTIGCSRVKQAILSITWLSQAAPVTLTKMADGSWFLAGVLRSSWEQNCKVKTRESSLKPHENVNIVPRVYGHGYTGHMQPITYLKMTITAENGIRQQDISLVTSSVLNNPAGVDFAISYLIQHYQDIADFNNGSYSAVLSLISRVSGALYTHDQADQPYHGPNDVKKPARSFGPLRKAVCRVAYDRDAVVSRFSSLGVLLSCFRPADAVFIAIGSTPRSLMGKFCRNPTRHRQLTIIQYGHNPNLSETTVVVILSQSDFTNTPSILSNTTLAGNTHNRPTAHTADSRLPAEVTLYQHTSAHLRPSSAPSHPCDVTRNTPEWHLVAALYIKVVEQGTTYAIIDAQLTS